MEYAKRILIGMILLSAILLDACGSHSSTSGTDTLSAIYTSAAQTIEAQNASTEQPTLEQTATLIPTDTPSDISSPTSSSALTFALPTLTPYAAISTGCDGASYISDVTYTDHTVVNPGQTFVKTWMLQNTGSCTWDNSYSLTFVSGDQMGGTNTPIDQSVDPNQQAEVSVTLTAPTTAGEYTGYWRLANDSGEVFGVTVYVIIDVNEDATATYEVTDTYGSTLTPSTTLTPSITPTPSNTSTPKPTHTPTSTPTPKPTRKPTSTPTPKPTRKPTATPK